MNLIEKLGLEKCRQIVDGAPDRTASHYVGDTDTYFSEEFHTYFCHTLKDWETSDFHCASDLEMNYEAVIDLKDLRTALANHNSKPCQHGYDIACLICGFGTEDGVRVWRKQIEADNVTDIKNHISPNMKVVER